jgi:uncharacterized protein (DUF1015 family)
MAKINSFKAYLPSKEKAHYFAIKPDNNSLSDTLNHKKYSFLHTLHPNDNFALSKAEENVFYKDILSKFNNFVAENNFKQYHKNALYLYEQKTPNNSFTGIIGGANLDDYISGDIKKHESTLSKKITSLSNYFTNAKINTEPVLIAYNDQSNSIKNIINNLKNNTPDLDFDTNDKYHHKIWIIHEEALLNDLLSSFESIHDLYIADGHHRIEAAKTLYELNKETSHNIKHVMSLYIAEEQLKIKSFNRIITHIPENFSVENLQKSSHLGLNKVSTEEMILNFNKHTFMFFNKEWYQIKFNIETPKSEVEKLEVNQLNKFIFNEFNIQDISFEENADNVNELIDSMNLKNIKLLFTVPSIDINTIKSIADANEIMPAKSTYIEPKLRSGLTIYPIFE